MLTLTPRGAISIAPLTLLCFLAGCGGGDGGGTGPDDAVSRVEVSPAGATMQVGGTVQLTASVLDASGAPLAGRTVTWTSSGGAASVDGAGLVTGATTGGPVTITAAAGGKSGTAQLTVESRVAAQVTATPGFTTVSVGATAPLAVEARDAAGATIPNPAIAWNSLNAALATVSGRGATAAVSGVAPGVTRIAARVNNAADTSLIAVLGPSSLLSTSFIDARYSAMVFRGQTVTVPVMLDMSRASANANLGSVQFDLLFNASLLRFQSAVAGVNGNATFHLPNSNTFRFSFTGTAPQGQSNLTLVTVTFQVPQTAPLNANTVLVLNHTAAPTSTSGQPYELPVTAWGRLRVTQ